MLFRSNSVHYGYCLGTWNRIDLIMIAKFGWQKEDLAFYETFVSMAPVSGMLVGRLIGAFYVNYGRLRCIITGAFLQIVGITLCLISTVPTFLLGRFVYAFGSGFFFSSAFRYVEECSPPNYLSTFYTIYSFGISLHRPTTTLLSTLIIPDFNE